LVQTVSRARFQSASGASTQNGAHDSVLQSLPAVANTEPAVGNASPPAESASPSDVAVQKEESMSPNRASSGPATEDTPATANVGPKPESGEAAGSSREMVQDTEARVQPNLPGGNALTTPALPRPAAGKRASGLKLAPKEQTSVAKLSAAQIAALKDKLVIANFFIDRNDYSSAMQAFEAALKIDPTNHDAQAGLQRARQASGSADRPASLNRSH
jgi:hypothetical protein